jgi:hypothetical protein
MWSIYERYVYDQYIVGDLVIFIGYLYTPDYVYIEQYDASPLVGIVLGGGLYGQCDNKLYRVHWFRTGRQSEVAASHLRLAYITK